MIGMTAMVDARDLTKTFMLHHQGGVRLSVLSGFDVAAGAGECVALHAPSGAGKSTVLRLIYGNYRLDRGQILVRHGEGVVDVATVPPRTMLEVRRRTIGYVSQFLRAVPRVATLDVVTEPLRALGLRAAEAGARGRALLARLGIAERLWSISPATFSGGEQQRVNLARGFVAEYPILLLDEPTAALDAASRRIVVELIGEARQRGAAILGAFHDAEVREAVATRVVEFHGHPLRAWEVIR